MEVSFVGIDISKRKFDVALLVGQKTKYKSCANAPEGFADLLQWLSRQGVLRAHLCMEATGTYFEDLATALVAAGHVVSVVNPARIKGFGQGVLSRTKTDKSDAALIAAFCRAMAPEPWTPMAPEVRELRALVRRLDELKEMRRMEHNRSVSGVSSEAVAESLRITMTSLDAEIARTLALIEDHFDRHPKLKADRDLLSTIPGIADLTASIFLAEVGDVANFTNARQLAAYCGLTPREHQSGSSVRGRALLCKTGNARLRRALYMPAVAAKRCNPIMRALSNRLLERGKPKMVVICAVMRKLVHIAFGVLRSGLPFDPIYAAA